MTYPGIPLDGKPYPIDAADCQECGRLDFPVLLVRPSVVDKRHEASLASGTRLYDQTRDTAFGRMKRKGTLPVTRLLRQGYVYVYYQARGKWDLWRSHDDGTYLKLLELATPEQYAEYAHEFTAEYGPNPAGSVCSRGAVNVPAGLITLVGPGGQADIWVAYATHAWDPQVLNDYGAAKSTARALRMTHLNGQALMAQGVLPTMGSLLAQSTLEACIPEFSPLMPPAGAAHHPLLKVFERSASPLAPTRFGRAADYDAAARRLEASAEPAAANKALVLMLADPVGVAQDYNDIRLGIHEERQHWMNGGPDATGGNADPDRPWKRQSMLCAGYIRDWLRERQRANVQARHEGGAIKDTITITETEFQRIQADAAAGKPRYPAGTRYERLDTVPVVYRVHWPTTMVERGLEGMAQGQAQPRIDRYNGHLDWARIEHTNQQWLEQEQGWRELQEARDQDYVDWLRSEVLLTVLRHDYADRPLLAQSAREASQFEADLRNAMARLDAVARCYGGGACGPASLKHLIDLFGKDEDDPEHWIASAAIKPFDLLATLRTDPGAQASLYDVLVGNRCARQASCTWPRSCWYPRRSHIRCATWRWRRRRPRNWASRRSLRSPRPRKAFGYALAPCLTFWTQASAATWWASSPAPAPPRRQLRARFRAHRPASAASNPIPSPRRDARPTAPLNGCPEPRQRCVPRGLTALENSTVYLVFDQAELQSLQGQRGGVAMVPVTSHDLFGKPALAHIPADLADDLLREPQVAFGKRLGAALGKPFEVEYRLPSLAAVVVLALQGRALWKSIDDLENQGGLQRMEAAASIASASTGIAGAAVELAAIGLARPLVTPAGTPAVAMLAGKLPWSVRLRLVGGFLAGGGALFDAIAAYIKARNLERKGDLDSAEAYYRQFYIQLIGGGAIVLGSAIAWFVVRRLAIDTSLRIGLTLAGGTFVAASTIAAWLSGVGLVLWIIGVGVSFWAMSLEDDTAEIWLDRSYFGQHERTEGRFEDLEQELRAFGGLSLGVTVEVSWDHNWLSDDEVRATITLAAGEPGLGAGYVVDGFTDRYSRHATGRLAEGREPSPVDQAQSWAIRVRVPIGDTQTRAVRLTYAFTRGPEVLAMDHIWIEK
ncbi:T6SS effector BTH_I2691 family protein [Achromobacter xylosoxidans]|uniref:T6SS effector BTH_I2691 family protein n=1 Tax=Alcaligenes xylosoxydans xylosoxydans TaxID=85698 RepID=UPI001F06A6F1|nr:T6SS effector BTH_I2691 family protein [Achromobacter xylosoxidans]MCH1984779.1 hypothetical protein [Achromobacter xylosoxidans]MCH4584446.1 hypothetical protein [Achromobacter xylosoxidans]